jgi:hypothetical protein
MEKNFKQPLRSITTIYLLLPALLFAWGWLRFPFSLVSTMFIALFMLSAILDLRRSAGALKQGVNVFSYAYKNGNIRRHVSLAFLINNHLDVIFGCGRFRPSKCRL